ncbi:sterol desaturase family protein [Chitinolyticbacter albus]|uniref:sterol desaturase family protein n=1 Tax=Chitinolyticbacter albus TaxID=2961951 RepID=UPI00210B3210|nr:sterol desaturase family protein [Chitinolyticbacter albus]
MEIPSLVIASGMQAMAAAWVNALPVTLVDFAGTLAIAAGVLLLECVLLGWSRSSSQALLRPKGSARNDLWAMLLVGLGLAWPLAQMMLAGLPEWLKEAVVAGGKAASPDLSNPMLLTLLWFLCYDLTMYWIHRWSHAIPALWALHSYHHSADRMTVLTRFRFHPLEEALYTIAFAGLLALLPVPAQHVFMLLGVSIAHTCLKHSRIIHDWGWIGRHILSSPAAHHLHHSSSSTHYGRNYATTFQFWDNLFGTACYADRASTASLSYGVPGTPGDDAVLLTLWRHYVLFVKALLPPIWRPRPSRN